MTIEREVVDEDRARNRRTGPFWMVLVGLGIAFLAVVGTVVVISGLDNSFVEADEHSRAFWSAVLTGLIPFGVGLLVTALGLVLGRLDDWAGGGQPVSPQLAAIRAQHDHGN